MSTSFMRGRAERSEKTRLRNQRHPICARVQRKIDVSRIQHPEQLFRLIDLANDFRITGIGLEQLPAIDEGNPIGLEALPAIVQSDQRVPSKRQRS